MSNHPKLSVFCRVFFANPNNELNALDCCCCCGAFLPALLFTDLYVPSLIFILSKTSFSSKHNIIPSSNISSTQIIILSRLSSIVFCTYCSLVIKGNTRPMQFITLYINTLFYYYSHNTKISNSFTTLNNTLKPDKENISAALINTYFSRRPFHWPRSFSLTFVSGIFIVFAFRLQWLCRIMSC